MEKNEEKIKQYEHKEEKIREDGQAFLNENKENKKIYLMTIIGEIEGHDVLGNNSKTTKYEHIIPQLATIEDNKGIIQIFAPDYESITKVC